MIVFHVFGAGTLWNIVFGINQAFDRQKSALFLRNLVTDCCFDRCTVSEKLAARNVFFDSRMWRGYHLDLDYTAFEVLLRNRFWCMKIFVLDHAHEAAHTYH